MPANSTVPMSTLPKSTVPAIRVRDRNDRPLRPRGDFVLYWMIANRRPTWNFSLQQAVDWARHFGKPLVILEALRCGYRWASDRIHQFVVDGMTDNVAHFAGRPVHYYPYLESTPGAAHGLLESLADRACVVVTDEFPCFFLPRMVDVAARKVSVRLQTVDSNGLLPMHSTDRVFTMAHSFRRHLQGELLPHLSEMPLADPLAAAPLPRLDKLPAELTQRWPAAEVAGLAKSRDGMRAFPLDHSVRVAPLRGGIQAARQAFAAFVEKRLNRYESERNVPDEDVASGLSPYLHFGHISVHEIFHEVMQREQWTSDRVASRPNGSAHGWWNMSSAAESFLDELITWREIGYNFCSHRTDYDRFDSLPDWARATLEKHASDPRPHLYSAEEFERAATHDPLWNAAQRQLCREGKIHNYLRMLWGKKILEWSESPRAALDVMIELNNKYALDGRNPNSYSGIFWVLGRYDRAWGPERPIFGLIRYMTSENTARKVSVRRYLRQYGPDPHPLLAENRVGH